MAARKAKRKKPLGPQQAAAALLARYLRSMEKRQSKRPQTPSVPLDIFDPDTGWADVPRQTSPAQDIKRRFYSTRPGMK